MWADTLRRRVVSLRRLFGENQGDFAVRAGIPRSTLSNIETGSAPNLTIPTLVKIVEAGCASPDCLLGFDDGYGYGYGYVRSMRERPPLDLYRTSPTRQQTAAGLDLRCTECGILLISTRQHTQNECVTVLSETGHSHRHLAARFGVTLATVDFMIEEETRLRRSRLAVFTDELRPLLPNAVRSR